MNNDKNNQYFDDLNDIDFLENQNSVDSKTTNQNNNNLSENEISEIIFDSNDNQISEFDSIFEMFPKVEKSLILDLSNEMSINELIDLLIEIDNDSNEEISNIPEEYRDNSISLVGCENVPRRRESIIQTLRNRISSNRNKKNDDTDGYIELSQYDPDF